MKKEIKTVTKEEYNKIESEYSCLRNLESYQERLSTIFGMGLYLCPLYEIEGAKNLSTKIYQSQVPLPSFTLYNPTNASSFNWARAVLFSLLIPIYERKKAMDEF